MRIECVKNSQGLASIGIALDDLDTDDDGMLDATGDATAVPFGTLRYDTSADKVQAFVSGSDGLGTDGWVDQSALIDCRILESK